MINIHESFELAELKTEEYWNKFNELDKYDQMMIDYCYSMDGIETAMSNIDYVWSNTTKQLQ